jgi:peptidoglycan/xylan/chitin deacetylase (PgdA/CDA1 family)
MSGGRAAILMYHRVAEVARDPFELCTPPEAFRAQLAHVASRYAPMALDELARAAGEGALPDRAVAVTLDDGYLDNLTTASPILLEHEIPATFFVTSHETSEYWWDALARSLPEREMRELHARALELPAAERNALLAEASIHVKPHETDRPMRFGELRELAARPGHALGAHSVHHVWLPAQSPDARRREIEDCKATLQSALHRSIDLFAYPFGARDGATVAEVARAGFAAAVTVEARLVRDGEAPLELPRVAITSAAQLDALFG